MVGIIYEDVQGLVDGAIDAKLQVLVLDLAEVEIAGRTLSTAAPPVVQVAPVHGGGSSSSTTGGSGHPGGGVLAR